QAASEGGGERPTRVGHTCHLAGGSATSPRCHGSEDPMQTAAGSVPTGGSLLPPGPRTPRLWQSLSYSFRPYATVESARPWGDRYTIEALGTPGKLVVFSDPEAIRDIFGGDGDTLRAGEATG